MPAKRASARGCTRCCTGRGRAFRPRSANSLESHVRAKNPRSSARRSGSITQTPSTLVSLKIIRSSSDELAARERLRVPARRRAPPSRGGASARGRAPRRTSACRAGSGTPSTTSRAFSPASSSEIGTKTLGAPRSPSYFGISYSRMRWSRHVFQVSSQTSRWSWWRSCRACVRIRSGSTRPSAPRTRP